ncbi:hypothetical protein AB0C10_09780 [Microbispora amethystogenes]
MPGLLPRGEQITVRMLLNHTSGLADDAATDQAVNRLLAAEFCAP